MHVYLTGFMGTGKSTVGKALAEVLDCPFLDLDSEIERQEGETIAEIFHTDGEDRFRRLESAALRGLDDSVATVVATGGGILSVPGNRDWMAAHGITVWLDASFKTILDRLKSEEIGRRPLFEDASRARALFTERLDSYRDSDHRIEVLSSDSVADVAARVIQALEEKPCDT